MLFLVAFGYILALVITVIDLDLSIQDFRSVEIVDGKDGGPLILIGDESESA
jgi:hypothetical protein